MLLFSKALKKHRLQFKRLSDCMEHLPTVAKWAEDEWGYIRNKGVEYRKEVFASLQDNIYIGFIANVPVAMFALINHRFDPALAWARENPIQSLELMYVYVRKEYRGLGFGDQVINKAKRIAALLGAELILLDTLKPNLNALYEKHNAKVVCEGKLFGHDTDVLRMTI